MRDPEAAPRRQPVEEMPDAFALVAGHDGEVGKPSSLGRQDHPRDERDTEQRE